MKVVRSMALKEKIYPEFGKTRIKNGRMADSDWGMSEQWENGMKLV